MKNMWKYAMILVAALGCFACENPEVGETLPDYYSKTFVTLQTSGSTDVIDAAVENTPIGVVPKSQYNRQVVISLTKELAKDLTIELGADYSLVASRAQADAAEYKDLPEAALEIVAESIVIPAGEREVVVDLQLGDTSFASEIQGRENYMMPLVITKVSDPSVTISQQKQAVYCKVAASYSLMRTITSPAEIVGTMEMANGWTQEGADNKIIDGSTSTYWKMPQQTGNIVVIDMKEVKNLTGVAIRGYYSSWSDIRTFAGIEYSVDGENWLSAGSIDDESGLFESYYSYGAFYGAVAARYLRLDLSSTYTSSYYWYVYEVSVYTAEYNEPYAYLSSTETDNVLKASVVHMPAGSSVSVAGTITAHVSSPATSGYTANLTVDNSLIAAYNAAHGTSYVALPDGHLNIPECKIGSMLYGSEAIAPELTDITTLTEPGYLVPLRLSVDGLKTSEKNGIAYIVVTTEYNDFMPSPTTANIRGAIVSDRSAFKATNADTGANVTNLFDGSTSTYANSVKNLIFDLGTSYKVSAVKPSIRYINYGSSYIPTSIRISTSDDGSNWTVRGTLTDKFWQISGTDCLMVLSASVDCRYIKMEITPKSTTFYGLTEFNIYAE